MVWCATPTAEQYFGQRWSAAIEWVSVSVSACVSVTLGWKDSQDLEIKRESKLIHYPILSQSYTETKRPNANLIMWFSNNQTLHIWKCVGFFVIVGLFRGIVLAKWCEISHKQFFTPAGTVEQDLLMWKIVCLGGNNPGAALWCRVYVSTRFTSRVPIDCSLFSTY